MNKFLKDEHCEASEIPALKPVLQGWLEAQRDYAKMLRGVDYSCHYGERPCIGFLAQGAWRSGGVALEEWRTEKGPKAKRRQGRCDLWIFRHDRYEFHIEAKHMWQPATVKPKKQLSSIEAALSDATRDAASLTCARKIQLGILFLAPYYTPTKQAGMAAHIASWLEGIYSIPHSAIAWAFRNRKGLSISRDEEEIVPGLVLIARTTKRPKRLTPR